MFQTSREIRRQKNLTDLVHSRLCHFFAIALHEYFSTEKTSDTTLINKLMSIIDSILTIVPKKTLSKHMSQHSTKYGKRDIRCIEFMESKGIRAKLSHNDIRSLPLLLKFLEGEYEINNDLIERCITFDRLDLLCHKIEDLTLLFRESFTILNCYSHDVMTHIVTLVQQNNRESHTPSSKRAKYNESDNDSENDSENDSDNESDNDSDTVYEKV
jgi:hypothetical protein